MSRRLVIGTSVSLSLAISTYLYTQHRRLSLRYPTYPVPSTLEIDARQGKPYTTLEWGTCDAGDVWAVPVPPGLVKKLELQAAESRRNADVKAASSLTSPSSKSHNGRKTDGKLEETDDLGVLWARAFMGSWPLRLESVIIGSLAAIGLQAFKRKERVPQRNRDTTDGEMFQTGDAFVNGVFIVEAHDKLPLTPSTTTSTPAPNTTSDRLLDSVDFHPGVASRIILRWGSVVPPVPTHASSDISSPTTISILGGYHTLAILRSSQLFTTSRQETARTSTEAQIDRNGEAQASTDDQLYFVFASHAVHKKTALKPTPVVSEASSVAGSYTKGSMSTAEYMKDRPILDQMLMWFHHEYSRILVDLAYKRVMSSFE
ncbi:hypothetical protein IAU59_002965 [Kwoniella sp. CBS 9459]